MVQGLAGLLTSGINVLGGGNIPTGPSHHRPELYQDPAKLCWGDVAPSQQQKELLGVKQYKTSFVSPILDACRLGGGGGFLLCAWTSKEPK